MSLASGANVGLSYVKEVTHGLTPGSPSMKALRAISRNINLKKNNITSQERRADRQVADMRQGFNQVGGSLGYELCCQAFDDMLEGAMSGTWAIGPTTGSISLAAVASTKKYTRTTGSFITDGFMPGLTALVTGFVASANNGTVGIISVTALEMVVDKVLADDVSAAARTIASAGKVIKIGTTLNTYTFERSFSDVAQYQVFKGVAVNQMSISVKPDALVQGSLDLIGMSSPGFTGSTLGAPTAAASNSPLVAFDAALYYAGVAQAVVTGFDLTIANGRSVQPVVGSKFSPDVFEGTAQVTGTMTAFFEDATLYNTFLNEAESTFSCKLLDPNGTDYLTIMLPRVKTSAGDIDPPQEGPITINFTFQALVHAGVATSMAIQRSNA